MSSRHILNKRKTDFTYQDVPHVLIGSFKTAETDTGPQQTLTTPHVTGRHLQFPHPLGFRVVHFKFDRFFYIGFKEVFQQVALFVLARQRHFEQPSCDSADMTDLSSGKRTKNEIMAPDPCFLLRP